MTRGETRERRGAGKRQRRKEERSREYDFKAPSEALAVEGDSREGTGSCEASFQVPPDGMGACQRRKREPIFWGVARFSEGVRKAEARLAGLDYMRLSAVKLEVWKNSV